MHKAMDGANVVFIKAARPVALVCKAGTAIEREKWIPTAVQF